MLWRFISGEVVRLLVRPRLWLVAVAVLVLGAAPFFDGTVHAEEVRWAGSLSLELTSTDRKSVV